MKYTLALVGSPRRLGNCELAARYIAWAAGSESLKIIRIPSKKVLSCKACYRCLEGACPLEDDYPYILEHILAASSLIIATPTYFFGPNASLKKFLDRGLQLYSHYEELAGKPAVGVGVAGMEYGDGYTRLGILNMILRMGLDHRGTGILYGALPGEIFMKEGNLKRLEELSGLLVSPRDADERKNEKISCSLCGFPYFYFPDDKVGVCLICGARHKVTPPPELKKQPETGVDLFTLERQREHKEWLIGMKKRFLKTRGELKKVISENKKPGEIV